MMKNEIVILDGISRFGLRQLHVIGPQPIDVAAWIDEKCAPGSTVELALGYEEETLHVHHLRLYWRENGDNQQ